MWMNPIVDLANWVAQIDPMAQLAFWAFITSATLLYTFSRVFAPEQTKDYGEWRLIAAVILSLFWLVNTTMWFISATWAMIFTDSIFFAASGILFWRIRQSWVKWLTILYALAIGLDIWLWRGLIQTVYALLSNVVFVIQLLTVSVFFTSKNKKVF